MLSISKVFLAFFSFSDAKSRQKNLQNVEKDRKKSLKSEKIAKKITKSSIKIQKKFNLRKQSAKNEVNLKKFEDESRSTRTKLSHSVSVRW